jgi:heme/copper-type cytochrome/quinol oxidase subunit 3
MPTPSSSFLDKLALVLMSTNFKNTNQKHAYHILPTSAWPILTAVFVFLWLLPQTFYLHSVPFHYVDRGFLLHVGFLSLFITVLCWFVSIVKESTEGFHTEKVQFGLQAAMLLFIASEVMFFFAFFWSFFHFSLTPATTLGAVWPAVGTQVLSPWGLPLCNTILLLSSGVTVTLAHARIMQGDQKQFVYWLLGTIILGFTFLACQAYEYKEGVDFSWRDNDYGSIFFITTGFHGLHVTVGTLFLLFCLVRQLIALNAPTSALSASRLATDHLFGFEAAAWYWHFVDVVWLFLFVTIYWWGGSTI